MSTEPTVTVARGTLVRDVLVLSVIALVLRTFAALLVPYAPYTDAAYYTMGAERLATGQGFTAPAIWSFLEVGAQLPAAPTLPVPAFGHFQPLTSIVAAGPMAVLGPSWAAGQIPIVLLATALVPITYLVGWDLWRSRTVAIGGAVLALFAGPLLVMYSLIDNFAVFGAAGVAALWTASRAATSSRPGRWLLASGALVGLATLARIDGLLLAVAPAIAWAVRVRELGVGRSVAIGLGSAGLFLLVVAPWIVRDMAVFGSPLPSTGGHTLWITSYNDQFSIGHDVTFGRYLADLGVSGVIGSKAGALVDLVGRTAVLCGGIFVIFFLAGLWLERANPRLLPFIVFWLVMLAVMAFVFTFHAPHGAFYHSAAAWLPFALPLSVVALPRTCTTLSRWWRFLGRPRAQRFVLVVGMAGAIALSLIGSAVLLVQWESSHRQDLAVATFLRSAPNAVVMSDDPASLWLASGNPGIPIPFDPYPVIERAARAYGVRYLVVNIRPGESGDPLGLWAGGNAVDAEGHRATWLPTTPVFEAPNVRIYALP